jgi:hypothetical protein
VASLGYYYVISVEVLSKATKYLRLTGVPTEIRTDHLLDTSQEPHSTLTSSVAAVRIDHYSDDKKVNLFLRFAP